MNTMPKFTIFTPTYNRAELIHRVYDSLYKQTFRNFEWIVIDDGSTDATKMVIENYIDQKIFPITYYKKNNEGKVAAINDALNTAKGEWFIVFDSDDWCDDNALEIISQEIDLLDDDSHAAISVLKRDLNGNIIGDDYSRIDKYGKSYIDRSLLNIKGDKWEIIKTSVHKEYPYNLQNKERYMAPSFSWLMLAQEYNTVFINKALSTIEYQADGISKNNIKHRVNSCSSTIFYYQIMSKIFSNSNSNSNSKLKNRMYINELRFKLHQSFFIDFNLFYFIALNLYIVDKIKLRR